MVPHGGNLHESIQHDECLREALEGHESHVLLVHVQDDALENVKPQCDVQELLNDAQLHEEHLYDVLQYHLVLVKRLSNVPKDLQYEPSDEHLSDCIDGVMVHNVRM